jgi:membrane-associated phospholipid phosphatase
MRTLKGEREEGRRMHQAAGPLDESAADGRQAALARRWQRLREGAPSALYLLAWAVAIVLVGVVVGMLLAKLPSNEALSRADVAVDRWLAARHTRDWNTTTHLVTTAAETVTITILAVLTVAVTALAWRRWREPMLVVAAVTGEVVIFLAITLLVDRPRPPVPHLDVAPPTSSFPSGHTAAAIALYGSWAVIAWERARWALLRGLLTLLAIVVPIAVGLARMYRGMHFPTDVLAGAALGVSWLGLSLRAVRLGVLHHGLRAGPAPARRRRSLLRHG